MKALIAGAAILVSLLSVGSAVASEQVCSAQKAAAGDIVEARNTGKTLEEVIAKIEEAASSEASANVLSESVREIYADEAMGSDAAGAMIYERCIKTLGA